MSRLGFAPSASKSELLLLCQWPWFRHDVPRRAPEEYMRYGSGFHGLLANGLIARSLNGLDFEAEAKKYNVKAEELRPHVKASYETFMSWLTTQNQFGVNMLEGDNKLTVEKAVALRVVAGKAREIAGPTEDTHEYVDATREDLPGTIDVGLPRVALRGDTILIADHKSGEDCDPPGGSAQLATLAVGYAKVWKAKRAIVAINHAPRRSLPVVYADELSENDLKTHAKRLKTAFERIGDGSLTPGPQCPRCAAVSICPVYSRGVAAMIDQSDDLTIIARAKQAELRAGQIPTSISLETPEDIGNAHDLIKTYDNIRDVIAAGIKARIAEIGPGVKRNGKLVDIVTSNRENLSKQSILEAYGKLEGEKLLQKLREKGALKMSQREEMREVADKG